MNKTTLEFPRHISREAVDLISQMLDKNPFTRLSHPSDIRKHPFCQGIDFDLLSRRQHEPPLKVDYTRSNFDSEYTSLPITICAEDEDYDYFDATLSRKMKTNRRPKSFTDFSRVVEDSQPPFDTEENEYSAKRGAAAPA